MDTNENNGEPLVEWTGEDTTNKSRGQKKLDKKLKKHQGAIDGFSMSSETFETGMLRKREPTDFGFIIGFIVFIAMMGLAGIVLAITADPNKIRAHQDADRRFCGIDEAVKDYPLVMWTFQVNSAKYNATE